MKNLIKVACLSFVITFSNCASDNTTGLGSAIIVGSIWSLYNMEAEVSNLRYTNELSLEAPTDFLTSMGNENEFNLEFDPNGKHFIIDSNTGARILVGYWEMTDFLSIASHKDPNLQVDFFVQQIDAQQMMLQLDSNAEAANFKAIYGFEFNASPARLLFLRN